MSEGGNPSELPKGWAWAALGEVAESVRNGIFVSRPGVEPDGVPILRIGAVRPLRLDLSDLRYSGQSVEELRAADRLVLPGDLLFTRYNGNPDLVGACASVPDTAPLLTYPDKLIRVRVDQRVILPEFVAYAFSWEGTRARVREYVKTTAGQAGIAGGELKKIKLPVPPLGEQRRIVAALEEQLSLLNSGMGNLDAAMRRTRKLLKSLLFDLIPDPFPARWGSFTVAQAGTVDLGRQRHPDWHTGPEMRPYLRVANVYEDRIDTSDVKEMDFSGVFDRYRLEPGDVLLNEGQSPELVGRPAIYRGDPPNVAFTNSLLRFRCGPGVLPEWALLVFRRHMHVGRFKREARITTNIGHLSAARLKKIEFPIPSMQEQEELIKRAEERLAALDGLIGEITAAQRKATALHRSLLTEAFSGRLVPQDPTDKPADALLAHIRAEREAAGGTRARSRSPRRAPAQRKRTPDNASTLDAPPPPRSDAPALTTATQPTLDLEIPS